MKAAIAAAALLTQISVSAEQPHTGSIYVVSERALGSSITLGGTVVPFREVTLSAQIPGRVEYIAGEEGHQFREDDLLVTIDDDDLVARRRAAWAQLASADATLRNAGVQYSREWVAPFSEQDSSFAGMPSVMRQFVNPFRTWAGSSSPFHERQAQLHGFGTQVEQARNSLIEARSRIEEIDAKLRDARGNAPFDGIIIKKMAEVGDTMQPGQPLLKFADTEYLQIEVHVPARLVSGLSDGMIVPAKLDVGDRRLHARVAQIFPMADPERHTVTVKFDLPSGSPGGPGMYAEVSIPNINSPSRNRPVIPYSALVWRGSLPAVYVLNDENRTELRLLRIGEKLDQYYVSVLSGVRPGERVIGNPDPGMSSGWSPVVP